MSEIISALIVFVREQRQKTIDQFLTLFYKYWLKKDFLWMKNFYVSVHDFLTCWIRDEQNSSNLKKLIEKKIRCKSQWQNKHDHWKRNYVWFQKNNDFSNNSLNKSDNKVIDQIQIILIVKNSKTNFNQTLNYCEVLMNLLKIRNKKISNEISDMIELQFWFKQTAFCVRTFDFKKFYSINAILRNAHIILNDKNNYYVNNFVDWNTYNKMYHSNFMRVEIRQIQKFKTFI